MQLRPMFAPACLVLGMLHAQNDTLYRPTLIGFDGAFGGGQDLLHQPPPAWRVALGFDPYMAWHPTQVNYGGNNRSDIHGPSLLGDLTHGGGARWILDVRADGLGSKALIATPEGSCNEVNPSWYYAGPSSTDATNDRVLLTNATHDVRSARWSVDGTKVAFEGTDLATNDSGIFLGSVTFDTLSRPVGLTGILRVAVDGTAPTWGHSRVLIFLRAGAHWLLDVTYPLAPVETLLPVLDLLPPAENGAHASLAHDERRVAYAKSVAGRTDLYVFDLLSLVETRVTNPNRISTDGISHPSWSPNDQELVFSAFDHYIGCSYCEVLYRCAVSGTSKAKKISSMRTAKINGQNSIVGSLVRPIWRL